MIIELPHVGESVTEGVIGKWLKSVGERVERYDPLVEVVTDKINMEMPSPVTGTLTAILVEEGATIPMGTPIAEMDAEDSGRAKEAPPAQPQSGARGCPAPAPRKDRRSSERHRPRRPNRIRRSHIRGQARRDVKAAPRTQTLLARRSQARR